MLLTLHATADDIILTHGSCGILRSPADRGIRHRHKDTHFWFGMQIRTCPLVPVFFACIIARLQTLLD